MFNTINIKKIFYAINYMDQSQNSQAQSTILIALLWLLYK